MVAPKEGRRAVLGDAAAVERLQAIEAAMTKSQAAS
jgi:hypothetical protein